MEQRDGVPDERLEKKLPDLRQILAGRGGGQDFTPLLRIDPRLRWGTVLEALSVVYPLSDEDQISLGLEVLED